MRIVIAPNALKGSLSAVEAAEAMAEGVRTVWPDAEIRSVPVADGGDGIAAVLAEALGGELRSVPAVDPLGRERETAYARIPAEDAAVVEMALASGLALLDDTGRDPLRASTFGTGQLIRAALEDGAERIIVGIGGSATNDGGTGMAQALGVRFFDASGEALDGCGANLERIARIDASGLHPAVAEASVEVICDVDNPLLGPDGASRVYGPQKGASPDEVDRLEAGMANLADRIASDLGMDVRALPGAGAAGGLGAGLRAFLGGELRRGVDVVLDLVRLDDALAGADLALTAEGALDNQTAFGKAPAGVARRAKAAGVPCLAIAGSVGDDLPALHEAGLAAAVALVPGPLSLDEAMRSAAHHLRRTTEQLARAIRAVRTDAETGRV